MTAQTILPANSVTGGFEVANSARFDGAYHLVRSKGASETGLTKGTFSLWVKRTNIDGTQHFLYSNTVADSNNRGYFSWRADEKLRILTSTNNSSELVLETSQLFRDPSAWYHIVYSIDTTQGTAANRCILYINGTRVTAFDTATYMDQNSQCDIFEGGQTNKEYIGGMTGDTSNLHSYLAEYVYIDGLALAADQFGEFDEDSGIWKPIDVSDLTFGNEGFYLDFQTSAELGDDVSGNTNDFTESNLTAVHQSTDTCTNNFCTINPLDNESGNITITEGNLNFKVTGNADETNRGTFGFTKGKWYFESKYIDDTTYVDVGVGSASDIDIATPRSHMEMAGYYMIQLDSSNPGVRAFDNGSAGSGLGNSAEDDIHMYAIDMDNNKFYAGRNGTWYASGDPAGNANPLITMDDGYTTLMPAICTKQDGIAALNFGSPFYAISSGNADGNGHGNFEYAVPSGYFALCTKNLTEHG